ncbi:MAG TPA: hypothetical protein V6C52_02740 [Coleofasciculaceae cyanobacterium]
MSIPLVSAPAVTGFQRPHRPQPAVQFGFLPGLPGFPGSEGNNGPHANKNKGLVPIPTNEVKPPSKPEKVRHNGIDELNSLNASKATKPGKPGLLNTLITRAVKLLGVRKQPPQEKPTSGKGHFIA